MAEHVRSIAVMIEVDTNKRTLRKTFHGESIADAVDQARDYVDGNPDWEDLPTPAWEEHG